MPAFFHNVVAVGLVALCLVTAPAPSRAQAAGSENTVSASSPDIAALVEELGLTAIFPTLRMEGVTAAETLEADMFPGRGNARWMAGVSEIYRVDRMAEVMTREMAERLPPEAVAPVRAFFTSGLGTRIVSLEVSAREAMLDPSVEEASRDRFEAMRAEADDRVEQIERFMAVNDLIESNVAGALNSNLAFYNGLLEGDAFGGAMTEDEVLNDVWSQAEDIRADTTDWLYAYLSLAYQPLTSEDLDAYLVFSQTAEGEALNAALFGAFDTLFNQISYELGLAAARMMSGEDI